MKSYKELKEILLQPNPPIENREEILEKFERSSIYNRELTRAEDYFKILAYHKFIESEIEDWLIECFDLVQETDEGYYYVCEDFRFDDYDDSFELLDVDDDWEPTEEQLKKAWDFGFSRCWICYKDGGERYYSVRARYKKDKPKKYKK